MDIPVLPVWTGLYKQRHSLEGTCGMQYLTGSKKYREKRYVHKETNYRVVNVLTASVNTG